MAVAIEVHFRSIILVRLYCRLYKCVLRKSFGSQKCFPHASAIQKTHVTGAYSRAELRGMALDSLVFLLSGVLRWRKSGRRDEGQLPSYPDMNYAYVQHHPITRQEEFLIRGHDTAQRRIATPGSWTQHRTRTQDQRRDQEKDQHRVQDQGAPITRNHSNH